MAKTISFGLNAREIDAAAKEIQAYRLDLSRKVRDFVTELSKVGVSVVKAVISDVSEEDLPGAWDVQTNAASNGDIASATITLTGNKVLFIEFGAGIRYASPQNPRAAELGYGPGTYPGQSHVPAPGYWFYKGDDDETHKSYGNRAYMPMYHASEAIALELRRVAKGVFGK